MTSLDSAAKRLLLQRRVSVAVVGGGVSWGFSVEDVADIGVGAVGWVELVAAFDELVEFVFERGELSAALLDIAEFGLEEIVDVGAWGGAVVSDVDDAADLGEGEPCGLGVSDEPQPSECRFVVEPVAVGGSTGLGEQPASFIESDGSGRQSEGVGELTNEHCLILPLDLLLWIKVYGAIMEVKLLYFDDCPNWKKADTHLRVLASEIPDLVIARHLVETPEEAERVGFRGSPSILVDGVDIFADPDAPVGLSCRVYRTPEGSAGSPTLDQLREALTRG